MIKTCSLAKAIESLKRILQQIAPALEAQVASEQGIPLPAPLVPPEGGPAPGETIRKERPPLGPGPNLNPVDQNPAASAASAQQVTA